MSARIANIRALKDKLSAYLRDVQRGDVILVTDRGRVVAELRPPGGGQALDSREARLERLVEAGVVSRGLPHDPSLYKPTGIHLPDDVIEAAIAADREDRV